MQRPAEETGGGNPPARRGLRARLGEFWGPAALLFIALRFGDVVNAITGIWLVPHYVPQEELGAVLPLAQVAVFIAMPLSLVLTPYTKLLNVHAERGETGKVKAMLRDGALLAFAILLLALVVTPFFLPLIFRLFDIQNGNLALAIVLSAMIGAVSPLFTESLRALRRFGVISVASAIAAPLRFAVMALALPFRGLTGYFVGQASGPAFQSGVAAVDFLRRNRGIRCQSYWREDKRTFLAFLLPLALLAVAGNLRNLGEMLPMALVPKIESAAYYQLTRFTEMASYLGTTVVFVLFPVVSARHERGVETRGLLVQSMALSFAGGLALTAAFALVAPRLFDAVSFLQPYAGFTHFILPLGLLASVRIASSCFTTHETACSRFRYLIYTVPIQLAEAAVIYLLARGPWRLETWHLRHVVLAMLAGASALLVGNIVELLLSRPKRAATT